MNEQLTLLYDIRDYVRRYGHDRNMVIDHINSHIIRISDELNNAVDNAHAEEVIEDIGKDAEEQYAKDTVARDECEKCGKETTDTAEYKGQHLCERCMGETYHE